VATVGKARFFSTGIEGGWLGYPWRSYRNGGFIAGKINEVLLGDGPLLRLLEDIPKWLNLSGL
jgi:hypothetical protein